MQFVALGVASKKGYAIEDKGRVYLDFSAGWDDGSPSLNEATPHEDCVMVYTTVMEAARVGQRFWLAGGRPHASLLDVEHAFRNLMARARDQHLLGMIFPSESTGDDEFYYDRCISFGGARYPKMWDSLASACQWAIQRRFDAEGLEAIIAHLIDDWIAVGYDEATTARAEEIMTAFFAEVGLPEAVKKHVSACQWVEYLGLILDLLTRRIGIPADKRIDIASRLRSMAVEVFTDTNDAESLLGKMGFIDPVIPAARPLVSALYEATMPALRGGRGRVYPNRGCRDACNRLAGVIESDPFVSWDALLATPEACTVVFAVDAAGEDGMGGFCLGDNPMWFHAPWPDAWKETSSTLKELRAATAAAALGAALSADCTDDTVTYVLVHTDSRALVGAVNKGRSKSPALNEAVADLLCLCASRGISLVVSWHRRDSSLSALAADALSHCRLQEAARFAPQLLGASRLEVPQAVLKL